MNKKKILLVSDLPGYGKVALSAMFPIFSHLGFTTYNLPTALVSNTFNYGDYAMLDTFSYMENTLKVWRKLNFRHDCICTGFVVSSKQVKIICEYIREQRALNPKLYVAADPIMADDGKLYNGIAVDTVDYMRSMIEAADLIVPNFTEATFLTGRFVGARTIDAGGLREIIDRLRGRKERSVVITSVVDDVTGAHSVSGYDRESDAYFTVPFDYLPCSVPGTGDIFLSFLVSYKLQGFALQDAVKKAAETVFRLIWLNKDNPDTFSGIPLEEYLHQIGED
ncbi:MAG TPA: phosphomethylpyrimidine kinase [Porphyromonadaceae bacterium]|nr:phosphomethylpyrimidine kinase [Porphyromonadaceae bacterium]